MAQSMSGERQHCRILGVAVDSGLRHARPFGRLLGNIRRYALTDAIDIALGRQRIGWRKAGIAVDRAPEQRERALRAFEAAHPELSHAP